MGAAILDRSVIAGLMLRNGILYGAGISPERRVSDLSKEELRWLARTVREACKPLPGRGLGRVGRGPPRLQ